MLIRGQTWRELPLKYGTPNTAHRYISAWAAAGVFQAIWQTLLELLMHHDQVHFKTQVVDGSDKPVNNLLKQFTSMGYKHKTHFH